MKKTSAKKDRRGVKIRKLKLNRETVRKLGKHDLREVKGGAVAIATNSCAGYTRSVAEDGTSSAVNLIVPSIGIR